MRVHLSRFQPRSDDEIRYLRLARGMRAIAAALVVGGIVVATFETAAPPAQRVRPTEATPEDARAYAVVEPHAAMATAAPAAQAVEAAARNTDPASARLDRDKEQRG